MQQVALLVTVDVEEDLPGWKVEPEITVRNAAALPRLHSLCQRYGVRPTWLTTYQMAVHPESHAILTEILAAGEGELAAHLHPWSTPPLAHGIERSHLRPSQLPVPLMAQRLRTLTETLEARFGVRPTAFRAGRFGMNADCLAVLENQGYKVDSSVTSGLSWEDEGGEDFRFAPPYPYHPARRDLRRKGSSPILEVPVSVGFSRSVPPGLRPIYLRLPRITHLRGLLSSDHLGLLDFSWLSPHGHTAQSLCRLADGLVASGSPVLNLFFHSSELFVGSCPYASDQIAVEACFTKLETLFDHVMGQAGRFSATLSEYASQVSLSALPSATD